MNVKVILRNAVGRVARLGDLYDFRTDTFVDFSAFHVPVTDDDIEITKMPKSNICYINDENFMEKFEKLDIEPELRASILANLVSLSGHGKYLETELKHKKMRKSIFYSIRTKVEKLILTKELPFSLDSLDLDFATHFVVGIVWGANTIITLEEKDYSANAEIAETELKAELNKLEKSISDKHSVYDISKDKYAVEMFSDILPSASNLPKNIEEAKETLKKISRLVQKLNRGKGKQIEYILMSISDLDDYLNGTNTNDVFSSLDENAIQNMTNFIGEIMEAKREINDVVFKFENHANYIPIENFRDLRQMKSEIEDQEMQLRNKFKDAIIAIRSGNGDSELIDTIYTKGTGEFLVNEIRIRLKEFDKLLMKIDLIDEFKTEEIDFIGSDVTVELDEIKRRSDKVYILYLRAGVKEFNIELWSQNKLHFFHLFDRHRYSSSKTSKFAFVGIDLDVRQDLKINDKEEEGALICLIDNGNVVDSDAYGTFLRLKNTCYTKIYGSYENQPKPSRRIELQLRCPGSFKSICNNKTYKWHCLKCKEPLSFGFDEFFYCLCGRAPSRKFSYKCTDDRHDNFLAFTDKHLKKLLSEIPPLDELNVLILGVTGVGKSTWINAFLNYLAFPSLEEASQGELLSVTASAFQLTDEDDVTHTIRFGHDENEVLEPGQSATQDVKAHLFPIGNTLLRLIDTPGIGDVRGVEQDKENFDKILKYLSTLKYLNGICILLKPNESRLNVLFEFCVKELLTHLHKNASKNVVFCFTHSRETFYKPGDTRQPLAELLWKNQIDLNLQKNTMYCMDNESFRFLCAANQGIQFRESVMKSFSESWTISVEETNRLISHFKTMQPHVIDDTISLNDARKNIVCLTKPIADISKNIQQNLALIKDKQDMLTSSKASKQDLVKMLYLDTIKLETEPLNHPRTVCGAPSCVEYHPAADGTVEAIEYVTHCHPHCYLNGVPVNIVGDTRLQQCWAMNGTLNCTQCGCSWDQHLHITYVQNRVTERITVQDVQSRITGKESEEQQIQAFIETVEDMRLQLEEEQRKIIEVSVKLGRYLSKNAILPYNDVLGRYIDHLIDKEEQKVICGGSGEMLKRLKAMKEMYDEEEKALIAAMAQPNAEELTFSQFHTQLNELYTLQINGAQLQNAIQQASSSSDGEKKNKDYEKFHAAKNKSRSFGLHSGNRFRACVQSGYAVETKKNDEGYISRTLRWVTTKFWRY